MIPIESQIILNLIKLKSSHNPYGKFINTSFLQFIFTKIKFLTVYTSYRLTVQASVYPSAMKIPTLRLLTNMGF